MAAVRAFGNFGLRAATGAAPRGSAMVRRRNALVAPGDHLILTGPEIAAETVLRAADPRAA